MLAKVLGALPHGLEVRLVEVQVDLANGGSTFILVGLAGGSVREAKERVRAAIHNSGQEFPLRRLTVNLAPAGLRKQGAALDLPIAVAICLAVAGRRSPRGSAFLGELSLDGAIRHVNGVLVMARSLAARGIRELFVPAADAAEAALATGLTVRPCTSLCEVLSHLSGEEPIAPFSAARPAGPEAQDEGEDGWDDDLSEVSGQEAARRSLEVAAAGGHHLLMIGPPGGGKTMLARCLPGLLPPLTLEQALEVTQVRSVLGELREGRPLEWRRPFQAPHHSISMAGLVGGGSGLGRPGEISRAHLGVLFLDELAEFRAATLQSLRQPLEQGRVVIIRGGGAVAYPSRFQLVAATNPCPCGWADDPGRACRCPPGAVQAYRRALSGPLLDRIDLQVTVPRTAPEALGREAGGEPSRQVRDRVMAARTLQLERQGMLNSALRAPDLRRWAGLQPAARGALERWTRERALTARAYHRAWRVSRTLADLEGAAAVAEHHVLEALGYRLADLAA